MRHAPGSKGDAWRAWTIQPLRVWKELERRGELRVDRRFYLREDGRAFVPRAYAWLAAELRRRVRGSRGRLPWWAYGEKPDLRFFRHHLPRKGGADYVRLELRVDPRTALRFPTWAWDGIFCGFYLALTRREWRAWRAELIGAGLDPDERGAFPRKFERRVRASWSRLFRPGLPARAWRGEPYVQGDDRCVVFETLRLDQVVRVEPIRATPRARRLSRAEATIRRRGRSGAGGRRMRDSRRQTRTATGERSRGGTADTPIRCASSRIGRRRLRRLADRPATTTAGLSRAPAPIPAAPL